MAIRHLLVGMLIVVLASCSTMRYNTDYDPSYDFSKLKTYDWVPDPTISENDKLFEKHFHSIMGEKLAAKGMSRDDKDPDFLIAYYGNVERKIDVQNWGYRYPGWYGGVEVYQYDEGTIVVDFVDAHTKDLIYRGTVSAEVNRRNMDGAKQRKLITEAAEKILSDFPPKK